MRTLRPAGIKLRILIIAHFVRKSKDELYAKLHKEEERRDLPSPV